MESQSDREGFNCAPQALLKLFLVVGDGQYSYLLFRLRLAVERFEFEAHNEYRIILFLKQETVSKTIFMASSTLPTCVIRRSSKQTQPPPSPPSLFEKT